MNLKEEKDVYLTKEERRNLKKRKTRAETARLTKENLAKATASPTESKFFPFPSICYEFPDIPRRRSKSVRSVASSTASDHNGSVTSGAFALLQVNYSITETSRTTRSGRSVKTVNYNEWGDDEIKPSKLNLLNIYCFKYRYKQRFARI